MGTTAEASYYDNAYFVANPLRRSARLEAIGRIGQTTVIPWMKLLGLSQLQVSVRNIGPVSSPQYSYVAIADNGQIPTELVALRPFLVRALGDLMRVCGVESLHIKDTAEDIIRDMAPTWAAFGEMPETPVRIVDNGHADLNRPAEEVRQETNP